MTTSSNHHRPATAAAVAAIGALLAVTSNHAQAIPERMDAPAVTNTTAPTTNHYVERPCFITPPTWNDATDGPLPRCRTYVR